MKGTGKGERGRCAGHEEQCGQRGGRGVASQTLGDHELALLVGGKAPCGLALGGEFVKEIDTTTGIKIPSPLMKRSRCIVQIIRKHSVGKHLGDE